jgi:acyl-[acyl-carrier-protein]-phospholipid O-acyltransferase / long-chain-fatty-acid--[acyl-carrier-protein] ligase
MDSPATPTSTTRHASPWGSLWRVVENQAHNALNDKVAQFILLAVSQVIAVSAYYPQIVAALLVLPQLFFAPVAGWLSDRLSKRRIIIWCSMAQTLLLLLIGVAFYAHLFWVATILFFGLAFQMAIFAPAKTGIVKELVGERGLTVANGWMQMTIVLSIAGGQLLGGKAFEHFHDGVFHDPWLAAAVPMLILAAVSLLPLLFAFQVMPTPAHNEEKFRAKLFTEHFTHLGELFRKKHQFLPALGVSFFWLAATMLMLMLIQMANLVEPNAAARAALSSEYLLLVGVGVMLGSFLTGWLSANRIELGLVPLGGVGMAAGCVLCAIVQPGGLLFCIIQVFIGIASALFMVPLSAYLQDKVEAHVRGRILAAAGLLDSLGMMFGILFQLLLMKLGVGIHGQFVALGILCIVTAAYVLRIIPQNFLRLLITSSVKIVYRVRVVHAGRMPETGGVLLISNHVSYIDALVLCAACERPVRFAAYDEFFKNPLIRAILRIFGVPAHTHRHDERDQERIRTHRPPRRSTGHAGVYGRAVGLGLLVRARTLLQQTPAPLPLSPERRLR